MHDPLPSVDAIVAALGGTGKTARLVNALPSAVSNWKALNRFPPDTYVLIRELLDERGLTAPDTLWNMRGQANGEAA